MKENTIIQGTTPTFCITLPFEAEELAEACISFRQPADLHTAEKRLTDCSRTGYNLLLKLTQEDTLALHPGPLDLQLRLLLKNGACLASGLFRYDVLPLLSKGVLV